MKNQLFLVCPFSNMEHFIRQKFGQEAFFLTAMAGQSQFHELRYTEAMLELIDREQITELYLVQDTSCRFMNGLLDAEPIHGSIAENKLEQLLVEHYAEIKSQTTRTLQLKKFAAINLRAQLREIGANVFLSSWMAQNRLEIKGLITTKAENEVLEIQLGVYEL